MNDEAYALLSRIQGGDKIGAIKRLRELTGASLLEAKDAVEGIHTLADAQTALIGVPGKPQPQPQPQPRLGDTHSVDIEVRKLALGGQRIAAIKLLRQRNGLGLKEAKDVLDQAVPPPPHSYGKLWLLWGVFLIAMAAAAAFVLIQT